MLRSGRTTRKTKRARRSFSADFTTSIVSSRRRHEAEFWTRVSFCGVQLYSRRLAAKTTRGRQVYFQINRQAPIFPELQNLILKPVGVVDLLREALAPLAEDIVVALLFGSGARGT